MEQFIAQVYRAVGADQDVAAEVARHLVRSSLSGHDSHGVIRVGHYLGQIERGEIIPSARPAVIHETEVMALVDGKRGFGHFATAFTLDCALTKARQHGLAAAAIRHCNHIGRLGEYTERPRTGVRVHPDRGCGGVGNRGPRLYGASGGSSGRIRGPWPCRFTAVRRSCSTAPPR